MVGSPPSCATAAVAPNAAMAKVVKVMFLIGPPVIDTQPPAVRCRCGWLLLLGVEPPLQGLVPALIVHGARKRGQHVAEFLGVSRNLVGFIGLLVLPDLDDFEVVGAVLLKRHIE